MAKFKRLNIGYYYSKKELVSLINEKTLEKNREGLFYCKNRNSTLLFVTLDKRKKDKNLHYNDFFQDDYFHWDSQNKQHANTPRIKEIIQKNVDVHLFCRIQDKIKNKTQPFVYCGELEYLEYDQKSANPVHITFLVKDYLVSSVPKPLKEIYNWRPGHANRQTKIETNYNLPISPARKRTYSKPNKTERRGLVTSRVGQGWYRDQILTKWNRKCPLTGCQVEKILIASHIVSWSESSDEEKLDVENGILLSPNVDALFDRHLISFSDEGNLLISLKISKSEIIKLGIDVEKRIPVNPEMIPYLQRHREKFQK